MSQTQLGMAWCLLIGLIAGVLLVLVFDTIHYRSASMEYGDGQVLMLLLDTYPTLTEDARKTLIKYLGDGYITQWEHDVILRKATQAVFYDLGDVMKPLVRPPC